MRIIAFDIETSPFSFFAPVFNFGGLYDGQSEIYFETPQDMAKYIGFWTVHLYFDRNKIETKTFQVTC